MQRFNTVVASTWHLRESSSVNDRVASVGESGVGVGLFSLLKGPVMSLGHHGDSKVVQRLLDQLNGTAKREYPRGRMGHDDDGALSYVIATDLPRQTIIIRFGKPVEWVGMGIPEAEQLRDALTDRIHELRGVTT